MYEITLFIAGAFVTLGLGGIIINLISNKITVVRKPLAVAALVVGVTLEYLYIDFFFHNITDEHILSALPVRIILAAALMAVGVLLTLMAYTDQKEYDQIIRNINGDDDEQ